MKRFISIIVSALFIFQISAYAIDFTVTNTNEGIVISGKADKKGDNVNVAVYDRNNKLVYINQKKCTSSTDFDFKAALEDTEGLRVKVGGEDYSPILAYSEQQKEYNTYYVYKNAPQEGNGTKALPYKSIGQAYENADEGDKIILMGENEWDSDISGEKRVVITGDGLSFKSGDRIGIPVKFERIALNFSSAMTLSAGDIEISDGTEFSGAISLNADEAAIKCGNYNNITAKKLLIEGNIDVSGITNSTAVILKNEADIAADKISNAKYIVKISSGGETELRGENLLLKPLDGRYVCVNGGEYEKIGEIAQKGTYNVSFDYDFKLHSVSVNENVGGYVATVQLSMYNRNKSQSKANPMLVAGIYDNSGKMIAARQKSLKSGASDSVDLLLGKLEEGEFGVKIYVWDSFENMSPLCDVAFETQKDKEENVLFVSPDGNDSNKGSFVKPFKTLNKAIRAVSGTQKPTTIYLREGTHKIADTVSMTSAMKNITIKPYENEKAVISTGYTFKGSVFSKVSDSITESITDAAARAKVFCVSLADLGISEDGNLYDYYNSDIETVMPTLSQDGKDMPVAAYPDSGYLSIGANTGGGANANASFNIKGGILRAENWKSGNIFADGYPEIQWRDSRFAVNISRSGNDYIFTQKNKSFDLTPKSGERIRFINLPEEISVPGEWYLDNETRKLYIYPYAGFNDNTVISFTPNIKRNVGNIFSINGAENITFEGITFDHIGTDLFNVQNSSCVSIKKCTFTDILGEVLRSKNCSEFLIEENVIKNVSGSGFRVDGGNSEKLIKANNIITNNEIYDYAKDRRTYAPAIAVSGCGNTVSHNKIYNAPHMAINIGGIDFTVEYNDISNVCNDTADAGAIYGGQYIHFVNNKIRYNYFHNIKNRTGLGYDVVTVYFDDLWSSCDVYSNIFYDVERGGLIGGGRSNSFRNNIFISCGESVLVDSRGENTASFEDTRAYTNLIYSPYRSELWKKEFPEVYNILNDDPKLPKYNKIIGNVMIDTPNPTFQGKTSKGLTTVSGNKTYTEAMAEKLFSDYKNNDFTLTENSDIFKSIPDFKNIDFNSIGIEKN